MSSDGSGADEMSGSAEADAELSTGGVIPAENALDDGEGDGDFDFDFAGRSAATPKGSV